MFSKSALDDFSKWQICTCFCCFCAFIRREYNECKIKIHVQRQQCLILINTIKMMHDNNKLTISPQPSCMVVAKDIK